MGFYNQGEGLAGIDKTTYQHVHSPTRAFVLRRPHKAAFPNAHHEDRPYRYNNHLQPHALAQHARAAVAVEMLRHIANTTGLLGGKGYEASS